MDGELGLSLLIKNITILFLFEHTLSDSLVWLLPPINDQ